MIVEYLSSNKELTYTEQVIKDFILKDPQSFLRLTIKQLSAEYHVSMASITRLCRKLGFQGFVDFKVAFAKEMKDMERMDKSRKITPFDQNAKIDNIVNELPYIYERAIGYTQISLNKQVILRVVEKMKNSTVLVFGTGINKAVGEIFAYKIEELGIMCKCMDSVHYQFIDSLHVKHVPMFAILLSHRGKNETIIAAAKFLKGKQIPTLLICSNAGDELHRYCDEILYTIHTYNTKEFGNTQFTMAEQYLLDILYSLLFVQNLQLINDVGNEKTYEAIYKGEQHDKRHE